VRQLLADIGRACSAYQDETLRNLSCKRIQCDEIWSFCYSKQKNIPPTKTGDPGVGDVWTWVALDADRKLVPTYFVDKRDPEAAQGFMADLTSRLSHRIQLTTDGPRAYMKAVEGAFGFDIDYTMLVKLYGAERPGEARYSPAECIGVKPSLICGAPDPRHVSTSFVERQNLTMRMSMRRFTRLTNAFSKKVENHEHAVSLHFMHYNFCRIHKTLGVTPAMAAGVTTKLWEIEDIVGLIG
jgi:IS1 family transposase